MNFKLLPCYIKSKLFTPFCTDAYGWQLRNLESREVHHFYIDQRKVVCKLWRLPYINHCNLMHTINNSLPHQTDTACSWLVCHSATVGGTVRGNTVQIVSTYPASPEARPPSFLGKPAVRSRSMAGGAPTPCGRH